MKRAVGASEPPGLPTMKSQSSPGKAPSRAAVQLKDSSNPPTQMDSPGPAVQKRETSESVSPQRKESTPSAQSGKPDTSQSRQASPAPQPKTTQERQNKGPEKPQNQTGQPGRKQSNVTAETQQESGGFFGFGGSKSQPDPAKPAESSSGKMFGFGSSIFSSASTLITSAVNDQPKTTPPISPKMSPAKGIKSPAAQRKEDQPQQTKASPLVQAKVDKAPSELPKAGAGSQVAVKPGQSTCPLCKVGLNIGSKDLPNYNACTECKNNVCNQCGFNPTPNETGVRIENIYIFVFLFYFSADKMKRVTIHLLESFFMFKLCMFLLFSLNI